jgi:type IV pilus assembly protein PilO
MEDKTIFEKIEDIKMPIRIGIFVGTIVLLAAAFVYFVYMDKQEKIAQTQASIQELDTKLNRAKNQRKKLPKVRAEKKQVDDQFDAALKLLPNEKEIPDLVTKITALGADAGLDLRVFTPKSDRKKEFYKEIPISLRLKGTYHNVAIFFEKVGRMERIMNIQNVNMKPERANSTTLNVTCEAITYTFRGD